MSRANKSKGFTLVEVTIILLVLVILSAILLPVIERYIDLARYVKCREDIGMIAAIIELFKVDTCGTCLKIWGDIPSCTGNQIDLLVSDGNIASCTGPSTSLWGQQYGDNHAMFFVDTMTNQLALGDPFGPTSPGNPYPRPYTAFGCGWRGAYISTPITGDPWGNRYMVNVAFLGNCVGGPGMTGGRCFGMTPLQYSRMDVFVLSAGPDGTVHTPFAMEGVVAQGDDQIALISGNSGSL